MNNRIPRTRITSLIEARRGTPAAAALGLALFGINDSERAMRTALAGLRRASGTAIASLDATRLPDAAQIAQHARDFADAYPKWTANWVIASALLTEDEQASLTTRPVTPA